MSTWRKVGCCLIAAVCGVLLVSAASAEELWTYSGNVLTQKDGGWAFNVSDAGVLTCKTVGTATTVDLRVATLPADVPTIVKVGDGDLNGKGVCTHFYVPETVKEIGKYAFYKWSALEYIRLPDALETVGLRVISDCPKLVCIEPCLPHAVHGTVSESVRGCPLLTNVFEVGFATDESGTPLATTLGNYNTYGNNAMPGLRFGPAITSIPQQWQGTESVKFLDFGENVASVAAFGQAFEKSLTNVIFRRTEDFNPVGSQFKYGTKMQTVVWSGWLEYEPNGRGNNPFWCCKNKWCRFIVPGDNVKWRAFIADPSKVTPWSAVSAADRTAYFNRYGADAATPVGISKKAYYGLPETYICIDGAAQSGCVLGVPAVDPQFGTLSLDPEPEADGTYASGTDVTVTFTPAEGVTFHGWRDAPELGTETIRTVAMTSDKAVTPLFAADTWRYDTAGNFLYDGAWKIFASATPAGELTVTSVKVTSPLPVDLRKPIEGDRTVVALGAQSFSESAAHDDCGENLPPDLTGIYLPDTLKSVGAQTFDTCYALEFCSPCVPDSVETFGERVFQHTRVLTNALHIGYATNSLTHEPIFTELYQYVFWDAQGMTGADFGPGITNYNKNLWLNGNNFKFISFGPNMNAKYGTTFAGEALASTAAGTLTNVVFKSTEDISFLQADRLFRNCKKIREVTWNGWFDYEASPSRNPFDLWDDLQCRFIVPGDNPKWIAYCVDINRVTPWKDCSEADKATYFNRYGADAAEPAGISVAVLNGLPRTYIVKTAAEVTGFPLSITTPDARFASVSVSPEPPETALYPEGTKVTVTLALQPGVDFLGWEGTVADEDRMNTTLEFTMDEAKALTARYVADHYVCANGELTDGLGVYLVSGEMDALALADVKACPVSGVVDLRKPVVGGALVRVKNGFIRQGDGVREVYLPDTVAYIEAYAFGDWNGNNEIELITPCYPAGVSVYEERSLQALSAMTNGIEVGFATNAAGESVETVLPQGPWQCRSVSYLRFGPGIYSVPRFCHSECGSIGSVEFGPNVTNILELYGYVCANSLTNVVFLRTEDFAFTENIAEGVFRSCTKVREVTWNGWFTYVCDDSRNPFSGWTSLQCRFIYPGDNAKWAAFCGDEAKVTPWDKCSEADKAKYFERYGQDAAEPVGITVAVSGGLPKTYLVSNGKTLPGYVLGLERPNAAFLELNVTPELPESGVYAPGTEVTIEISRIADGVTFKGWAGTVAEEDRMKTAITLVMDGPKSVNPTFVSDFWVYEGGLLMDGVYTFRASGDPSAITVGTVLAQDVSKVLDWAKPVKDGAIVALAASIYDCKNASTSPGVIKLPGTLRVIGARTICFSGQTSVSPLVPQGVTNIEHDAFLWATTVTNAVAVGFATDEEGNPIETTIASGAFARCLRVGPEIRIGPGIRNLNASVFASAGMSRPSRDFYFSAAVTNISGAFWESDSTYANTYRHARVGFHFEGEMPTVAETVFAGLPSACVPDDGIQRFYVPRDMCPKWAAFADDETCVTPWRDLAQEQRDAYWATYPKATYGKRRPTGLTTAAAAAKCPAIPANQWFFIDRKPGTTILIR